MKRSRKRRSKKRNKGKKTVKAFPLHLSYVENEKRFKEEKDKFGKHLIDGNMIVQCFEGENKGKRCVIHRDSIALSVHHDSNIHEHLTTLLDAGYMYILSIVYGDSEGELNNIQLCVTGSLHNNETSKNAMLEEIYEESGLKFTSDALKYIENSTLEKNGKKKWTNVFYTNIRNARKFEWKTRIGKDIYGGKVLGYLVAKRYRDFFDVIRMIKSVSEYNIIGVGILKITENLLKKVGKMKTDSKKKNDRWYSQPHIPSYPSYDNDYDNFL
jgi:hypothetical protein